MRVGRDGMVLVLLAIGITSLQNTRLQSVLNPSGDNLSVRAETQERKERGRLALLETMPDFGFRNLIADWTFLSFLQYFGNKELRQETGYRLSGDYFDVIVKRDPYYYLPYVFLSSSVSIFAAQPERAIALQEQGLKSMTPEVPPRSYFVWRHKGIDEILFLGDTEAAQRSHQMASNWAAQSSYPGSDEDSKTLQQTADFLAQDPENVRIRINAWAQVLSSAPDDETRSVAVENIRELGGDVVKTEAGNYQIQYSATSSSSEDSN